ncbi:MAG TPA: hypothetical protein VII63_06265 [Caulobacteraceae bacterium]
MAVLTGAALVRRRGVAAVVIPALLNICSIAFVIIFFFVLT